MALLILVAALWGVVLLPTLLKRRSERRQVGSIEHFHHQLHLLDRAAPKIVSPAYRLETAQSRSGIAVGASGYPAISSQPERPNLVLLRPVAPGEVAEDEVVDEATGDHYQRVRPPQLSAVPAAAPAPEPTPTPELASDPVSEAERRMLRALERDHVLHHEARRRRRNFLGLLAGTTVFTLLLGLVPSLHVLWVVTVLCAVAFAAYVTLAFYASRNELRDLPVASRSAARVPSGRAAAHAARRSDDGYGGRHSLAVAGYPGAWDDELESAGHADGYDEMPERRAAAR